MNKEKLESLNEHLIKVRLGDQDSVGEVYDIMAPTVRYIALKYLKNENEANDAVQDFWADIKKYASTFLIPQNAYRYLCRIATRQIINRFNKKKRDDNHKVEYVDYSLVEQFRLEDIGEESVLRDDINEIMAKLEDMQRMVILETFFLNKSERKIAAEQGITKSMVSRLKAKAIEIMKKELTKKGWDDKDI